MEDEGGVKAPVTRLRRRLSVEHSDEAKASSAPNTPTKKRGARRPAKPELDLIDENAPENITAKRTTKKIAAKEIEVNEEKPVTPSRRSARIKSNSSIVLESTQAIDSPRAKRAARRTSQVGSDNEAPLTPARQTRRNRKDSANAEKVEPEVAQKSLIKEKIIEEPESSLQKSRGSPRITIEQNQSPSGLRQSPRLSIKNNVSTGSDKPQYKETNSSEEHNTSNKENETTLGEKTAKNAMSQEKGNIHNNDLHNNNRNKLSESSSEILNQMKLESSKIKNILNKSSSAVVDIKKSKSKRQRAKSWTILSEPAFKDLKCNSDSEISKEQEKKDLIDDSNNIDLSKTSKSNKLNLSSNKKRKSTQIESKEESNIQDSVKQISNEKLFASSSLDSTEKALQSAFDTNPTNTLRITVYESDSNSDNLNVDQKVNEDDQCVPVVQPYSSTNYTPENKEKESFQYNEENLDNIFTKKNENKNDSCEPMDVDETLPDNLELNKSVLTTGNMSQNKVVDSKSEVVESIVNERDQRCRSSFSIHQTPEKTANENGSTLVLSHLKTTSNENVLTVSPQSSTEKVVSKPDLALDEKGDVELDKKSRSLNYLTSTPLQQKNMAKLATQVNTSSINSNNTSRIDKSFSNLQENKPTVSNFSNKSIQNSTSDDDNDESSMEKNKFVDDEAEEASDDYESGDSKDEDQERYELENEIVPKGETLTSEDELSNDTDYEKDSFVVSSDEEDGALLDGSGDDLSMTDDELKMTAKSKRKYNEHKIKEQKKASREMFESRHKLNVSNQSSKSRNCAIKKKRAVLDSTDSEDNNMQVTVKKGNRMRLDSSHEINVDKSLNNDLNTHNDSLMNEVEMTICEENAKEEIDPLSIQIKKEIKTPQKESTNHSIEYIDPKHTTENEDDRNKSQTNDKYYQNPLEESSHSDSSDSCDNVHIQNYDSILNNLNKSMKTKKSKDGDISLNLDKKSKSKSSAPIVDQLNLTQVKTIKLKGKQSKESSNLISKNKSSHEKSEKSVSEMVPGATDSDNESSDSIDLNLLFSEESNSSEKITQSKTKNDTLESNNKDSFIPLKHTQGKTNIFETSGINESAKKKNKKHQNIDKSMVDSKKCDDMEVQLFYVDTTGTHNSTTIEKSFNGSDKNTEIEKDVNDDDAPVEIFDKNTIKKRSNITQVEEEINKSDLLVLDKTPSNICKNNMKTKRLSKSPSIKLADANESSVEESSVNQVDVPNNNEEMLHRSGTSNKSLNISAAKTPRSDKKKKKRVSESQATETICDQASVLLPEIVTNISSEDKLHENDNMNDKEEETDVRDKSLNKSLKKTPKSEKKNKKMLLQSQSIEEICEEDINTRPETIPKLAVQDNVDVTENEQDVGDSSKNKSMTKTPNSDKKKKKKLSQIQSTEEILNQGTPEMGHNISLNSTKKCASEVTEDITDGAVTNSSLNKTPISEKRKSKKTVMESKENDKKKTQELVNSKKRKRNSSLNQTSIEQEEGLETASTSKTLPEVTATNKQRKKKRKISCNIEDPEMHTQCENVKKDPKGLDGDINVDIKGEKLRQPLATKIIIQNDTDITDITTNKKKGTKKRKEREDDEGSKTAKVPKIDSLNKIQVPRLPKSVLNQLEDKPKKTQSKLTKPNAISTTEFDVEESKILKTKPSRYLEDSIYIDENDTSDSKKQKKITNPKVLPFLPTVSTSNSGYTTNFKVNVIPKEIKFVAKSSNVSNYKNDYLENKKIKRLGTYELYKRNRKIKMSKF